VGNDIGDRAYRWFQRHSFEMSKTGTRWRQEEASGNDTLAVESKRLFYIHMKACDTFRGMFGHRSRKWTVQECPECGSSRHSKCIRSEGSERVTHTEVLDFIEECYIRPSDPFVETAIRVAVKLLEVRPALSDLEECLEECQSNFADLADSIKLGRGEIH